MKTSENITSPKGGFFPTFADFSQSAGTHVKTSENITSPEVPVPMWKLVKFYKSKSAAVFKIKRKILHIQLPTFRRKWPPNLTRNLWCARYYITPESYNNLLWRPLNLTKLLISLNLTQTRPDGRQNGENTARTFEVVNRWISQTHTNSTRCPSTWWRNCADFWSREPLKIGNFCGVGQIWPSAKVKQFRQGTTLLECEVSKNDLIDQTAIVARDSQSFSSGLNVARRWPVKVWALKLWAAENGPSLW